MTPTLWVVENPAATPRSVSSPNGVTLGLVVKDAGLCATLRLLQLASFTTLTGLVGFGFERTCGGNVVRAKLQLKDHAD